MSNNRFLSYAKYLDNTQASSFSSKRYQRYSGAKTESGKCPQYSEAAIGSDEFVLDVLEFFFEERLKANQLNDNLRDVAADAVWRATQGSEALDLVPRPSNGKPGIAWLVTQAVQIGFRRAQNRCIYEAVRLVVKAALKSDYQYAKIGAVAQSYFGRPFSTLTTSDKGIDFIKQFEAYKKELYNDAAGHCTIGYGTLVHRGNCDGSESTEYKAGISEARATELLKQEVGGIESAINSNVTVTLSQCQFDSLVSFTYNVGTGAFKKSTLLKKLNQSDFDAVPTELKKWVKAGGKTLQGLVRRRNAEADIFTSGIYSTGQSFYASPFEDKEPRGIRNNNPGNIEINKANDWEGKVPLDKNTDGRFEQFVSYDYGVRALIILLRNYVKGGRDTITKVFAAYAPPGENNTQAYIKFVAGRLNIGADATLPLTKTVLKELAQAIGKMENGKECISDEQFEAGWGLVSESIRTSIPMSYGNSLYSFAKEEPYFDIRTCTPDQAFNTTWTKIKNLIISTANDQYSYWTKSNGSRYAETDSFVTSRLQEYWKAAGLNYTAAQLQDANWQKDNPWSAAFISWVIKQAGGGNSFKYSPLHMKYVSAAKQNTVNKTSDNPFWLCNVNNALPEPGDLICRNRGSSNFTFDTVTDSGSSHSDIVVEVDYSNNKMIVIGGNKTGDTVGREEIRLTNNGLIDTSYGAQNKIFAVLKVRTDKCDVCGTSAVV
jgi:GH24 family phage-related lysozyme (muramidase)